MENETAVHDDKHHKTNRLMGKLFGRERKATNEAREQQLNNDVNDFLRNSSDVSRPAPPTLAKIDIRSAPRYPNALNLGNYPSQNPSQSLPVRPPAAGTRNVRRKASLVVRFVDTLPEIIGEGGDESSTPAQDVGNWRRARAATEGSARPADLTEQSRAYSDIRQPNSNYIPTPLRRTQTGHTSGSDRADRVVPAGRPTAAPFLDSPVISKDENRKSFIELQQAQMREAEGLAFAQAVRSASGSSKDKAHDQNFNPTPTAAPDESPTENDVRTQANPRSPEVRVNEPPVEQSPSSLYSQAVSPHQPASVNRMNSKASERSAWLPPPSPMTYSPLAASPHPGTAGPHDPSVLAANEALQAFCTRTRHLFELFRLHSETVRPLSSCSAEELARASLWWFLHGRMSLETSMRDRSPRSEGTRQQAYADLAKAYWLSEEILPETLESKQSPLDGEVGEVRDSVVYNLRKLAGSMQRNGILPPAEALLPQSIDKSIWKVYPPMSQDIIALLWGNWASSLSSSSRPQAPMSQLELLPIGDTGQNFSFGRVAADVYLMEQGRESQRFFFPCMLSMIRPVEKTNLNLVLASQDGTVRLLIQDDKNAGPTWNDLQWRANASTLEMRLPRGFKLVVQLSKEGFNLVWGMYDFASKVQSQLQPRKDEYSVFRSTLRSFQYFDSDPQSRMFPKDVVPSCELGLYEKISSEAAAAGPRIFHRGFRIAVITGSRTRTLSGISHLYTPQMSVKFGFLRGEQGDPALLLKFEDSRSKGSMVLSFNDEDERRRMHSLLIGTALQQDERVLSEIPLASLTVSQSMRDLNGITAFKAQAYQRVRIINLEDGSEQGQTVLSDKLRMVIDFQNGSITDRINVEPGELKLKLDAQDTLSLAVLRRAQSDMTVAVADAQGPRGLGQEFDTALKTLQQGPTCRTYHFTSLRNLHEFQEALTGYKVLYDGVASNLAISRRRMVVPIYKKWEAEITRIQVVRQEKITQLLAFFHEFHHGHCMGFVLKGTDNFEASSKPGKAVLKIVDAKFPLPRLGDDGTEDAAFVCLDMPELPGEHDDITITFEKDSERDALIAALPAAVKNSRMSRRF